MWDTNLLKNNSCHESSLRKKRQRYAQDLRKWIQSSYLPIDIIREKDFIEKSRRKRELEKLKQKYRCSTQMELTFTNSRIQSQFIQVSSLEQFTQRRAIYQRSKNPLFNQMMRMGLQRRIFQSKRMLICQIWRDRQRKL